MFRSLLCLTVAATVLVLGFADDKHQHHAAAAEKHPAFETLKTLVGSWVMVDKDGKPTADVVSVMKLTANGSAIHETLFPGQEHEMVTVYHRDGKDVIATHYCAFGNQPRYKIDAKSTDRKLILAFHGGTNFDAAKDPHMHEGSITILDANTIETHWIGYDKGKPDGGHEVKFKLARKK